MAEYSKIPAFNLKVVMRETGIKADTLRAWERRYGLPQPGRTAGGHRLYSEYDIETLKWLIERQNEGLSISRAVEMWQNLLERGSDPLSARPYTTTPTRAEAPSMISGATLADMRQRWLEAVMAFDETAAENALNQSFALYPLETVCLEVLQKGLSQIGQRWYENQATVQQEHFASELATRRLHALIAASPGPTRRGNIIVGAPTEEEHSFAGLLITLFLRQRGWHVVNLGINVPLLRLTVSIEQVRGDLVVFSAQQLATAASLFEVAQELWERRVPLAFGGLVFTLSPGLAERIPGYYLGNHLDQAVDTIEHFLTHRPPLAEGIPVSAAYQIARKHFLEQQPRLEAHVWQSLVASGMPRQNMSISTLHLSRDIAAALMLGDMDYLQPEIAWIEGFGTANDIPRPVLQAYFSAYHQAAEATLDQRARPALEWLERLSKNFVGG